MRTGISVPRPTHALDQRRWLLEWARLSGLFLLLLLPAPVNAQQPNTLARDASPGISWPEMRICLCFQGKGSCLAYDSGVLHELYARVPALKERQAVVVGNSSGSILAAYFGRVGFSDETVRYSELRLTQGDKEAVRNMENPYSKLSKLLRGRPTEISHLELREYIAFALGVDDWQNATSIDHLVRNSRAQLRYPTLIASCNREVLEDVDPQDSMRARGYKTIDLDTLTVSWKPEVFEFYQKHPERFAREHPDLRLGQDPRIGKAMTYFVDQSLFDLLSQIPPDERTADLRLMTTPADVATAILASVSEPTYFAPILESQTDKVLTGTTLGDLGTSKRRIYYGGYLVPVPVQDIRRMLPGIRVAGTGWRHNPLLARQVLAARLLADVEPIAHRLQWWADVEVNPDLEFQSHMIFRDLTADQEFSYGEKIARRYLNGEDDVPPFLVPAKLRYPAASAIAPSFEDSELYSEPDSDSGRRPLKTRRGLGPFVIPSATSIPPSGSGG